MDLEGGIYEDLNKFNFVNFNKKKKFVKTITILSIEMYGTPKRRSIEPILRIDVSTFVNQFTGNIHLIYRRPQKKILMFELIKYVKCIFRQKYYKLLLFMAI